MRKILLLLTMITIVYHPFAGAQNSADTLSDYCAICNNHTHVFIKPYDHTFKRELPFLITSAATFASGFIVAGANKTEPYTESELGGLDKNSINSFDRPATNNNSTSAAKASDYLLTAITILPAMFLVDHHTGDDILSLVVMSLEVFTFNYGVTTVTKNIVNRPRPYVYNTDVDTGTRTDKGSKQSFFSGHTSQTAAATFLFAKVISDYHPNMKPGLRTGIWIFSATVPAIEGYLRVAAGKHFPTDVITGYVIGAGTGWLIPQLHKKKSPANKVNMGFMPSKEGSIFYMGMRF